MLMIYVDIQNDVFTYQNQPYASLEISHFNLTFNSHECHISFHLKFSGFFSIL